MRFALVLLLVVMVGLVVPAESWWLGRRFRTRLREYWQEIKPTVIQAGVNKIINGRSAEKVDLGNLAKSLDLDPKSDDFRGILTVIDTNGDGVITPEEVDAFFN
ncbi:hypothetical protein SNE40_000313 [Patella caerulea]|uniref:EF-hand domain-containing protein n=1 Tax=Patella caerulea TaxID=87958 RepID=A0AAN8Q6W1_PATCE